MLDEVLNALLELLRKTGIRAATQYPAEEIRREDGAAVVVGIRSAKSVSAGFGGYLGLRSDPEAGDVELYGFQVELLVSLDIYATESEGARGCVSGYSAVAAALGSLPAGLRLRTLSCGSPAPDLGTGMFKCEAELTCAAHFVCSKPDDTGEFTDFALYGHVVNSI